MRIVGREVVVSRGLGVLLVGFGLGMWNMDWGWHILGCSGWFGWLHLAMGYRWDETFFMIFEGVLEERNVDGEVVRSNLGYLMADMWQCVCTW